MKNSNLSFNKLSLALVAILFLNSCTTAPKTINHTDAQNKSDLSQETVKKEVAEAINTIGKYSIKQKNQALTEAKSALGQLDTRINNLEQKILAKKKSMSEASKTKSEETLGKLRAERKDLEQKFIKLRSGSKRAWEELKLGFNTSFKVLETSLQAAYKEFQEN